MSDDNPEIEAMMQHIEEQFELDALEKRGAYALCVAQVAGEVMKTALAAGVPYSLAQEMAQDYWAGEMTTVEVIEAGDATE